MTFPGAPGSVDFTKVDIDLAARNLATFVHDMGLDGVDFNYEFVQCSGVIASCKWVDAVKRTRKLLPEALISLTTYGGGGSNLLGVVREVKDVIDFAQEDSYSGPNGFFKEMKNVVGERKVYYG